MSSESFIHARRLRFRSRLIHCGTGPALPSQEMLWLLTLLLVTVAPQGKDAAVVAVFDKAPDWNQFLEAVKVQRRLWVGNADRATVPPALAGRMERAAGDLRLLIVAQDWCVDSAN